MGKGKEGFLSSKIDNYNSCCGPGCFAIVLYIVYQKTAGFSTLKPKPKIERPGGISMYHNPTNSSDQATLQEITDLSMDKLA